MAVTGTVIAGSCSIASGIVSYRIHTYLHTHTHTVTIISGSQNAERGGRRENRQWVARCERRTLFT